MATTQPGIGFNGGYIRIGKETTWGSEIPRTKQIEVESVDLSLTSEPKFVDVISKRYRTPEEIYQGLISVGGSFTYPVRYEGSEMLIEELLGADTITEASTFTVSSSDKYFDFKEDGGGDLLGTVAEASYIMGESSATAGTLCAAIKTALEVNGAGTYTVTFSNTTKKITIAVATGASATQFLWKTGTHGSDNTDDHIGTLIGFADAADGSSVDSVVGDNAVITVFDHAFRFSDTITEGLSIEKAIDANLTTGKTLLYTGCKLGSMDFNIEPDGTLKATANIIAKNEELEETPTSGLSTSTSGLCIFHQGIITFTGADNVSGKVVNFSCTVNNNFSSDRNRFSRYIYQPLPSGKIEVTGTMTIEFDADTYYNYFINQDQKDFTVKFTGSEIKTGSSYELEFDFNYVYLSAFPVNPEDTNVVMVEMPFVCIADDSTHRAVEINMKNIQSTV